MIDPWTCLDLLGLSFGRVCTSNRVQGDDGRRKSQKLREEKFLLKFELLAAQHHHHRPHGSQMIFSGTDEAIIAIATPCALPVKRRYGNISDFPCL